MKKFLKISLLFVMTILMGVVCSCGDDDKESSPTPENQTSNDSIIGKWNATIGKNMYQTVAFYSDGTGSVIYSGEDSGIYAFTWKRQTVTRDEEKLSAVVITATKDGQTATGTYSVTINDKVFMCISYIGEEDENTGEEDLFLINGMVFYKDGADPKVLYPFCGTWYANFEGGETATITLNYDGTGHFDYSDPINSSENISLDFTWRTEILVVTDERGHSENELALVISDEKGKETSTGAYCYAIDETGILQIWPMIGQEEYFGGPVDLESYNFKKK